MARHAPARPPRFMLLLAATIVITGLYFAQEVLIPLALSVLFCFMLAPVVRYLERWRVGRVPAVVMVTLLSFGAVVGLGYTVAMQLAELGQNLDQYQDNIVSKFKALRPGRDGLFEKVADSVDEIKKEVATSTTAPATQPLEAAADMVAAEADVPRAASAEQVRQEKTNWMTDASRDNPFPVAQVEPKQSALHVLGSYLGLALGPLGTGGLVIVFAFFMLVQREDLRDRLIRLVGYGQLQVTTQALDDASDRISRYLLAQAIVNATYGIAIAIGLWLIGLTIGGNQPSFPNVILWGLLCAVLRFVPYIGPWIAAIFPLAVSLAVYKGFGVFIATGLMFVTIELLSNNIMEPLLYGSSTGLSTLAILVSAVFWTWLWGPVGLLLATPLTVCLVVVGKYVPALHFLDIMLGDEPVLAPHERVYQRLLAMDQEEAEEVASELLKEASLEQVYDTVLIPALALAEQDRHRGRLDEERQQYIRNAMREMIDELAEEQDRRDAAGETSHLTTPTASTASQRLADTISGAAAAVVGKSRLEAGEDTPTVRQPLPMGCTINVACLPSNDEADEIVALMLGKLLERIGFCPVVVSVEKLAGEVVEMIGTERANIVCVSALPPSAVTHSRYLCKRIHRRYPDISMVVGLWGYRGDLKRALDKITCGGTALLETTLSSCIDLIVQQAQPLVFQQTDHVDSPDNVRDRRPDPVQPLNALDPERPSVDRPQPLGHSRI